MAPSWFDEDLCGAGEAYLAEHGVDVISVVPNGVWRTVGDHAGDDGETIKKLALRTQARAVFVAGKGQRAIGAITRWKMIWAFRCWQPITSSSRHAWKAVRSTSK